MVYAFEDEDLTGQRRAASINPKGTDLGTRSLLAIGTDE